jgi:CheY-like chemotaxis protein
LLESRAYIVDTAVDGVDGWNAIRTAHYDLVVSDVDMQRMHGIQLVRHIKEGGVSSNGAENRRKGLGAAQSQIGHTSGVTASLKASILLLSECWVGRMSDR